MAQQKSEINTNINDDSKTSNNIDVDWGKRDISEPFETKLIVTDDDNKIMNQIKDKFGDITNDLPPMCLLSFAQGYAHEKDRYGETIKRVEYYLKKRKEYDFGKICLKPMDYENKCLNAWPVYMYGYDKQGHPVMYDEIGKMKPKELDPVFDDHINELRLFRFRVLHRLQNVKRIQSIRKGYKGDINKFKGKNVIARHIIIMDVSNVTSSVLSRKYRKLIGDVIGDESNLWPNTLYKMFFINAPFAFRLAWKILSNFAHPITVKKIVMCSSNYIDEMKKYIDIDQIPSKYGGKGNIPIKLGYAADIKPEYQDEYYGSDDIIIPGKRYTINNDDNNDNNSSNISNDVAGNNIHETKSNDNENTNENENVSSN